MPRQHLFGMFTGRVGNLFAAGHAGNFFDAVGEVERLDVGRGVVGLYRLGDPVVLIPMAGNLRQVRDTKNLMRARNMAQRRCRRPPHRKSASVSDPRVPECFSWLT